MGLRDVNISEVMVRLAERRIEEAMKEGKFDNLPGMGKPLDLEPLPADENARMMWWALRILKQNDYTPEEVRWRKALDHLRARIDNVVEEVSIAPLVRQYNELVRKVNTLGTNALKLAVAPLDIDVEVARYRKRAGGA
jgi:hypothetical protein